MIWVINKITRLTVNLNNKVVYYGISCLLPVNASKLEGGLFI